MQKKHTPFCPSSSNLTGILERKSAPCEIKQPRNPINRSVDIAGNKNSLVTDYLIKNGTASLRPPVSLPLAVTLKCKPN